MTHLEKYKRTWKYEDENWTCAIDEHLRPSAFPKYVASFEDKLSGDYFTRRCGTIKRCGETLIDQLEHHYEIVVPQHDLGLDNFATRQLEAEDAIDSFTMENSK